VSRCGQTSGSPHSKNQLPQAAKLGVERQTDNKSTADPRIASSNFLNSTAQATQTRFPNSGNDPHQSLIQKRSNPWHIDWHKDLNFSPLYHQSSVWLNFQ
jgi:hypothetical protein